MLIHSDRGYEPQLATGPPASVKVILMETGFRTGKRSDDLPDVSFWATRFRSSIYGCWSTQQVDLEPTATPNNFYEQQQSACHRATAQSPRQDQDCQYSPHVILGGLSFPIHHGLATVFVGGSITPTRCISSMTLFSPKIEKITNIVATMNLGCLRTIPTADRKNRSSSV